MSENRVSNTRIKEISKEITPGILKRNEDIELGKCVEEDCCGGLFHCPFCNKKVYKPARFNKTVDHINLSHFPHAVYYKDLIILKCFQDCRKSGHYHCPFCCKDILKRFNFKEHLINHVKDNNEDINFIQIANRKQPEIIEFTSFKDVKVCSLACKNALGKHYHCPICDFRTYSDVSSILTHVWRCAESSLSGVDKPKRRIEIPTSIFNDQTPLPHPQHSKAIKYHISIVRTPNDLPLIRCDKNNCCDGKFHCSLCTVDKFKPNYQTHLLEHYNVHWKNRVHIDGYSSLICYLKCMPSKGTKIPFHFHCPFCGLIRQRKIAMEVHVDSCHTRGMINAEGSLINEGDGIESGNGNTSDNSLIEEGGKMEFENDNTIDTSLNEVGGNMDHINDIVNSSNCNSEASIKTNSGPHTTNDRLYESHDVETDQKKFDSDKSDKTSDFDIIEIDKHDHDAAANHNEKTVDLEKQEIVVPVNNEEISRDNEEITAFEQMGETPLITNVFKDVDQNVIVTDDLTNIAENIIGTHQTTLYDNLEVFKTMCGVIPDNILKMIGSSPSDVENSLSDICQTTSTDIKWFTYKEMRFAMIVGDLNTLHKAQTLIIKKLREGNLMQKDPETEKSTSSLNKDQPFLKVLAQQIVAQNEPETVTEIKLKKGRGRPRKSVVQSSQSTSSTTKITNHRNITPSKLRKATESSVSNYSEQLSHNLQTDIDNGRRYNTRGKRVKVYNTKEYDEIPEESSEIITAQCSKLISELPNSSSDLVINSENQFQFETQMKIDVKPIASDTDSFHGNEDMQSNSVATMTYISDEEEDFHNEIQSQEGKQFGAKNSLCTTLIIPQIKMCKSNLVFSEVNNDKDKCPICYKEVPDFSDLISHLQTFHPGDNRKNFLCEICEILFPGKSSLEQHIQNIHGPKPKSGDYSCQHCDKIYRNSKLLAWHISYTHKITSVNLSCKKCDFKAKSVFELQKHKRSHRGIKHCEYCGKTFNYLCHLKSHLETVHKKNNIHTCEYCAKVFHHSRYLKLHLKRHSGVKCHVCHICNAAFCESNTLKTHLEIHSTDRKYRYICSYCGSKYNNKTNFEQHQNKHTGSKPFKCDFCPKAFGFKSQLMQHLVFCHTNERPYKCNLCEKAFKMKIRLTQHMTTHTGMSKYSCPHCHKSYTCNTSLKKHLTKCKYAECPLPKPEQREIILPKLEYVEISDVNNTQNQIVIVDTGQQRIESVYIQDVKLEQIETEEIIDATSEVMTVPVTDEELFVCSECNLAFSSLEYAQEHIIAAHT